MKNINLLNLIAQRGNFMFHIHHADRRRQHKCNVHIGVLDTNAFVGSIAVYKEVLGVLVC